MFIQVKQITFLGIFLFMGLSLPAQKIDTVVYSEADSMQDAMLEQLGLQLKSVNYKLWKIKQEQQEATDSLEVINREQAEQIRKLSEGSEELAIKLQLAEVEIESNDKKMLEEKRKFKNALFITFPSLFIVSVVLAGLLFMLVRKYKSNTEFQINALRKYTYEELEDVKTGYVNEIKRRVKKIASKLKPNPKKDKSKKDKSKKDKSTKGKSTKDKSKEDKSKQAKKE